MKVKTIQFEVKRSWLGLTFNIKYFIFDWSIKYGVLDQPPITKNSIVDDSMELEICRNKPKSFKLKRKNGQKWR